eukprot:SAG22_NODE_1227_length_5094_cov_5.898298_4_plen_611_part_00
MCAWEPRDPRPRPAPRWRTVYRGAKITRPAPHATASRLPAPFMAVLSPLLLVFLFIVTGRPACAQKLPAAPSIEIAPGVQLPLVSLGTAEFDGEELCSVTAAALALGYTAIDNDGGGRGTDMGRCLRGVNRSSFFLTAKVNGGQTKAQTASEAEAQLKALGLAQVDLLLLHHPTPAPGLSLEATIAGQWEAIEEFYRAGKARAVGVSNFCPKAFAALAKATVQPAVNQIMLHAGLGDDPDGARSFALARNVTPMAYSAIDQGNPKILRGEPYESIAARHGVTSAHIALRWITQPPPAHKDWPPVPFVVAAKDHVYLAQNLDIFGFSLTAAEHDIISQQKSCHAGSDHDHYPCLPYWPGGACNPCCCTAPPMHVGCCCTNTSSSMAQQKAAALKADDGSVLRWQAVPGTPRGLAGPPASCTKCGHGGHRSEARPSHVLDGPLANFSAPQVGASGLYVTGAVLQTATSNSPEHCAALCLRVPKQRCVSFNFFPDESVFSGSEPLCELNGYSPHYSLSEGRNGSYYLRTLARDDRPALQAVPWQISPPNSNVSLGHSGVLRRTFDVNILYLLGQYSVSDVLYWFRQRVGKATGTGKNHGWDGGPGAPDYPYGP